MISYLMGRNETMAKGMVEMTLKVAEFKVKGVPFGIRKVRSGAYESPSFRKVIFPKSKGNIRQGRWVGGTLRHSHCCWSESFHVIQLNVV